MKPVFLSSHGNKNLQYHQLCAQGCSFLFLSVFGNWADIPGFAFLENEEHFGSTLLLVQHSGRSAASGNFFLSCEKQLTVVNLEKKRFWSHFL